MFIIMKIFIKRRLYKYEDIFYMKVRTLLWVMYFSLPFSFLLIYFLFLLVTISNIFGYFFQSKNIK